jgi:hypothetical protein
MPPRQKSFVFPEPEKNGFNEVLLPIARKKSLRQVARSRDKQSQPVMVRLDYIRACYANCGLNMKQIGELVGVSRYTVSKVLKFDEGVEHWTVYEVLNVIGVEMAELFPLRRKKKTAVLPARKEMVKGGPGMKEHERRLLAEQEIQKSLNRRRRGYGSRY